MRFRIAVPRLSTGIMTTFMLFAVLGFTATVKAENPKFTIPENTSDEETIRIIMDATKNRPETVKSFKGSVSVSVWSYEEGVGKEHKTKLTTACNGNKVRMSCDGVDGIKFESLYDGNKTTEWYQTITGNPPVRIYKGFSGLSNSNFYQYFKPQPRGSTYLSSLTDFKLARREMFNGSTCIIFEKQSQDDISRLWVDIDRGFNVTKFELLQFSSKNELIGREEYVTELKQYGSDVWFPSRYSWTAYKADGTAKPFQIATYDPDFKINVPVSEDDLKLNIPAGLDVDDKVQGKRYKTP